MNPLPTDKKKEGKRNFTRVVTNLSTKGLKTLEWESPKGLYVAFSGNMAAKIDSNSPHLGSLAYLTTMLTIW